jgi:hypothetical protein
VWRIPGFANLDCLPRSSRNDRPTGKWILPDYFRIARYSPKISGNTTEFAISAIERQVRMLLRTNSLRFEMLVFARCENKDAGDWTGSEFYLECADFPLGAVPS